MSEGREAIDADWRKWAEHWDTELSDFTAYILPVFQRHCFSADAALTTFYTIGDPAVPLNEGDEEDDYHA